MGKGTREAPLDLQSAVDRCGRGQQIRVLPGRYRPEGDLVISRGNSGSVRCPKRIVPETGCEGRAVLDFGGKDHGFRIEGEYLVRDKGKIYPVIAARGGVEDTLMPGELYTGRYSLVAGEAL